MAAALLRVPARYFFGGVARVLAGVLVRVVLRVGGFCGSFAAAVSVFAGGVVFVDAVDVFGPGIVFVLAVDVLAPDRKSVV